VASVLDGGGAVVGEIIRRGKCERGEMIRACGSGMQNENVCVGIGMPRVPRRAVNFVRSTRGPSRLTVVSDTRYDK
jgi:hypothetical protein